MQPAVDAVAEKDPASHKMQTLRTASRPLPGGHTAATKVGDGVELVIADGVAVGVGKLVGDVVNAATVPDTEFEGVGVGEDVFVDVATPRVPEGDCVTVAVGEKVRVGVADGVADTVGDREGEEPPVGVREGEEPPVGVREGDLVGDGVLDIVCDCEPVGEDVPLERPAVGDDDGEQLGGKPSPAVVHVLEHGQATQVVFAFAPVALLYIPMGQSRHSRYSATVEYEPGGQSPHRADGESSVMYCPGAQVTGKIARSL